MYLRPCFTGSIRRDAGTRATVALSAGQARDSYGDLYRVFRTKTLSEKLIWEIEHDVAEPRRKQLLGPADIPTSQIRAFGLSVDPDEPPKNHVCIIGWPEGDDPDAKADRRLLAEQLAAAAKLTLVLRAA